MSITCRFYLMFCLIVAIGCGEKYDYSNYDTSQVQIARDAYGVPHIFGETDEDVVYGLAWAHAEDDFETIQQTLLAGKAMVGRHYGEKGAAVDFFVHLLETREIAAERMQLDYSPKFLGMIETYAHAINDFALKNPERVLLQQAFPVVPTDIISAYILSLAQMSGADAAIKSIVEGNTPSPPNKDGSGGSNAIALHSARTTTGETFLAINSHQPLEGPVAWYEAHLHSEDGWNILGGLFPGGLTIFHGVNEHLGWAHTVNYPDKLDVFSLEMNPENELEYKVDGQWLTLEKRTVWLRVKFWGVVVPVPKTVWKSIYGPTLVTENGVFSIRTGALHRIGAPEQWYRMNKAKNFTEFYEAMAAMQLTGFNTVYADKYDTIFYVSNALLPKRNSGYNYQTTLLGNTKDVLWTEFHAFDELPQYVNPAAGYLYNTNHSPFLATALNENLDSAQFPSEMGYKIWNNNRSLRFMEMMPDTGKVSYQDFERMKFDKQLPKRLAYETNIESLFSLTEDKATDIGAQIRTLNDWDKQANIDSEGAALFAFGYYYLRDHFGANKNENQPEKISEQQAMEAIRASKEHFLKHFGEEIVTLGTYQKLVRGEVELPLFGVPDVISAMRSEEAAGGTRKGMQGESYIMMVRFGDEAPTIATVNAYGASNRPESPHYADQMEDFTKQKLKPMTLDKAEVLKNAIEVYHPR